MLKRIWQWLKGLFQRLFGGGSSSQSSSYRDGVNSTSLRSKEGMRETQPPPPLTDSDYEYLFRELLEGVAHGWNDQRVARWFEGLKQRVTETEWVAWLRRFGERVLASPAPNDELGRRLVYLGDRTYSTSSLREIADVAYEIGGQLLNRNVGAAIWEYEGPDASGAAPLPVLNPPLEGGEPTDAQASTVEEITLDELFVRLQQDPNLLQLVAQQLGIETNDPQVIIQEVINQLNAAQSANDEAQA
jgi:hypothetical protein